VVVAEMSDEDDKLDMWTSAQQVASAVVVGTGMAEESEVLWDKDSALCMDFDDNTHRCYESGGNKNRHPETSRRPLLGDEHCKDAKRRGLCGDGYMKAGTESKGRAIIPCARGSTESLLK